MTNLLPPTQVDSSIFHDMWQYGLVNISGNDIKVSNIVVALLILLIGINLSKKLIKLIMPVISKKLDEDQDLVYTIERLLSLVFLGITVLLALQVANIPLAIFAFIGGAFAIGIGLGAQGLVNNLVNTMIIIIEKPIKIGDIVEIQGAIGKVKSIGTRCITVNSFTGEDVLVPNTIIMQNKFSKWSGNDNISYYIYINIIKKEGVQVDHSLIAEQLRYVSYELDFTVSSIIPEVYLTKVSELEDQFSLKFTCKSKSIKEANFIKNKINFALLKHLNIPFRIEYSNNLG
ncbi:MAG: mechanosensitive ion channel [Rickettsiaceae bacterium]|jgi:small-conductance mechanosensitive channel|nr:mechanosensitive ion channel [Rickettsiaceae bacterium]MCP5378774.1 mechanosensitive ion channel [Rickettsiaceae bacterium]